MRKLSYLILAVMLVSFVSAESEVGYTYHFNKTILHIWNTQDNYFFNTSSGIQWSNYLEELWAKNVFCAGYKDPTDGWKYDCNDVLPFTWQVYSDNLTHVNVTGWRDKTILGRDVRLILRYHLPLNQDNLSVQLAIQNIGALDVPYDVGFAWITKDIQIMGDPEDDYLYLWNGSTVSVLDLSKDWDMNFTNLDETKYEIHDWGMDNISNADITLAWNKNLNYKLRVISQNNHSNARIDLGINVGPLAVGQMKTTTMYWSDPLTMNLQPKNVSYYQMDENKSDWYNYSHADILASSGEWGWNKSNYVLGNASLFVRQRTRFDTNLLLTPGQTVGRLFKKTEDLNWSISAWVWRSENITNQRWWAGSFSTLGQGGLGIGVNHSGTQFKVYLQNMSDGGAMNVSVNMSAEQWYHVVVTYSDHTDEAPGNFSLYINGTFINSSFGNPVVHSNAVQTFSVGQSGIWEGPFFQEGTTTWQGGIDEVGIWNRTLNATEILFLYNNSNGAYPWDLIYEPPTFTPQIGTVAWVAPTDNPYEEYQNQSTAYQVSVECINGPCNVNYSISVNDSGIILACQSTNFCTDDTNNASYLVPTGETQFNWTVNGTGAQGEYEFYVNITMFNDTTQRAVIKKNITLSPIHKLNYLEYNLTFYTRVNGSGENWYNYTDGTVSGSYSYHPSTIAQGNSSFRTAAGLGVGQVNSNILIPPHGQDAAGSGPFTDPVNFSVSAWVWRNSSVSGESGWGGTLDVQGSIGFEWGVDNTGTAFNFFALNSTTGDFIPTNGLQMNAEQWYHIVITHRVDVDADKTTDANLTLYLNGTRYNSTNGRLKISESDVDRFIFGTAGSYVGFEWDGLIDEPAIWNRTLNESEIEYLYNSTVGAHPKDYLEPIPAGPCEYTSGDWDVQFNCNISFADYTLTGNITITDNINLTFDNSNLSLSNYSIRLSNNSELNLLNNSNISSPTGQVGIRSINSSVNSRVKLQESYVINTMFDFAGTTAMTSDNVEFYHNSTCDEHYMEFNNSLYYRLENSTFYPLENHSQCIIRFENITNAFINNNLFGISNGNVGEELISVNNSFNISIYNNTFRALVAVFVFNNVNHIFFFNNSIISHNSTETGAKPMIRTTSVGNMTINYTKINSSNNYGVFHALEVENLYIQKSEIRRTYRSAINPLLIASPGPGNAYIYNNIFFYDRYFALNGNATFIGNTYNINESYEWNYVYLSQGNYSIHNETFNFDNLTFIDFNFTFNIDDEENCHIIAYLGSVTNVYDSHVYNLCFTDFGYEPNASIDIFKSANFFINASEPDNYTLNVSDNTGEVKTTEDIGISGLSTFNYYLTHHFERTDDGEGVLSLFNQTYNNFTANAYHNQNPALSAERSINMTKNNETFRIQTSFPANCEYDSPGDWNVIIRCKLNNESRIVLGNTSIFTTGTVELFNSTNFTTNKTKLIQKSGQIFMNVTENSSFKVTGGIP